MFSVCVIVGFLQDVPAGVCSDGRDSGEGAGSSSLLSPVPAV